MTTSAFYFFLIWRCVSRFVLFSILTGTRCQLFLDIAHSIVMSILIFPTLLIRRKMCGEKTSSTPWSLNNHRRIVFSYIGRFLFILPFITFCFARSHAHRRITLPKHIIRTIAPSLRRCDPAPDTRNPIYRKIAYCLRDFWHFMARGKPRTHVCAVLLVYDCDLPLLSAFFLLVPFFRWWWMMWCDDTQHT